MEEEMKSERDLRFRQEKEFTNLRLDFDELEQQLDEATNARDREFDANKRLTRMSMLPIDDTMTFVHLD
jgi:hypothetical protein